MNEIIFNGKSSYKDLGVIVTYFKPQPPEPKIIKQDVPFMHGSYDFSKLYGEVFYNERIINCKVKFKVRDERILLGKYSEVMEWLLGSNNSKLIYTGEPHMYYIASVTKAPTWDNFLKIGSLDIEFTAYPFKFREYNEGSIPWDDFNFELDYMQETKFDVSGSKFVNIINPSSKNINPIVICSSEFNVIKDSTTYKFNGGTTKDWIFTLDKGENNLILNGNGSIEFVFRKEVL